MTKKQQEEALKLLERAYYKVCVGARYQNGNLDLITDIHFQHDIASFVKSVKKSSLKIPKISINDSLIA